MPKRYCPVPNKSIGHQYHQSLIFYFSMLWPSILGGSVVEYVETAVVAVVAGVYLLVSCLEGRESLTCRVLTPYCRLPSRDKRLTSSVAVKPRNQKR
jgi:hypothetical protein